MSLQRVGIVLSENEQNVLDFIKENPGFTRESIAYRLCFHNKLLMVSEVFEAINFLYEYGYIEQDISGQYHSIS